MLCAIASRLISRPKFMVMFGIVAAFFFSSSKIGSAQNSDARKGLKIPKPEDFLLPTKDGLRIRCTYFPGGVTQTSTDKGKDEFAEKSGKTVVPIVLLHGFKGKRTDFERPALACRKWGTP